MGFSTMIKRFFNRLKTRNVDRLVINLWAFIMVLGIWYDKLEAYFNG